MARSMRDAKLETRAARDRLKPRQAPHWRCLEPGQLHLGYRRRHRDQPGCWIVRRYVGVDAKGMGRYREMTLGLADDYQEADGKRALSYAEAQRLALSDDTPALAGPMTVADALRYYFEKRKAEGMATVHGAEGRAALHILPALGGVRMSELTTPRLNAWRDELAAAPARLRGGKVRPLNQRPLAETGEEKRARRHTTNKCVTILKAALNRCFQDGLIDSDKEWKRFKSFVKVNTSRSAYLTVEEAQRLINTADAASGFRDLVHAALLTGCRYGELCALRVKDFADGKIAIRKSKTGKPRHVRLTEEGIEFFETLTAGRPANEMMLLNRRLGHEWRKSEQDRPMREACAAARITPAVGIHQLRHTWASLSLMGGMPLLVIANNLGHRDTRMVELHYGHLAETYMDAAIMDSAPRYGVVGKSNVKHLGRR